MTKKYYWKVLSKIDDRFYSAIVNESHYCVEYKLSKTIYPHKDLPDSKLLVFSTRKLARRFKRDQKNTWINHQQKDRLVIYKVKVINPVPVPWVTFMDVLGTINSKNKLIIKNVWKLNKINNNNKEPSSEDAIKALLTECDYYLAPAGSIGVDSLELVERTS